MRFASSVDGDDLPTKGMGNTPMIFRSKRSLPASQHAERVHRQTRSDMEGRYQYGVAERKGLKITHDPKSWLEAQEDYLNQLSFSLTI